MFDAPSCGLSESGVVGFKHIQIDKVIVKPASVLYPTILLLPYYLPLYVEKYVIDGIMDSDSPQQGASKVLCQIILLVSKIGKGPETFVSVICLDPGK